MLALAVCGVAYTAAARHAMTTYWIVLAPIFGMICVVARWRDVQGSKLHWQLIQTQAFHWIAVILAMYLVFAGDVKRMMSTDASAVMVLTVLALGTFTAGVHVAAWRICMVGIVLGLGVLAIGWLEESTLLLVLVALVLIVMAVLLFMRSRRSLEDLS